MPDSLLFLRQFLRAPATIGAIAPSSADLAQRMTADVPVAGEPVVLELGPGTGAFTAEIQRRLAGHGRHVAIEVNEALAALLGDRYPDVDVVVGDAADAPAILADRGVDAVDLVVSGLPWAVFPGAVQEAILDAVTAVLRPGGRFLTFAYSHATLLPPAVRFRRRLAERFADVRSSATIWRNLPPARIVSARHPRTADAPESRHTA
jgi:phospholipid N-methyltransferase